MMRRGSVPEINYKSFDNPCCGLAAMIFVQAIADADILRRKQVEYIYCRDEYVLTLSGILKFLRSDWAEFLAWPLGLDMRDVWRYADELRASIPEQNGDDKSD